jgi:putative transposase
VDETTLGLHPVIRACWMKRGQQKRIDTPGQQQWHHLFGAYDFVTDKVFAMPAPKKNSDTFVAFLDYLAQLLPDDRPVVLVLDNASYHHSLVAEAGFAAFEQRFLPLFLPPYCSNLNPIERFWRHLKDRACANTLFPTMTDLVNSVLANLRCQNDLNRTDRFSICKELQSST